MKLSFCYAETIFCYSTLTRALKIKRRYFDLESVLHTDSRLKQRLLILLAGTYHTVPQKGLVGKYTFISKFNGFVKIVFLTAKVSRN